jgi:hypothetical protein
MTTRPVPQEECVEVNMVTVGRGRAAEPTEVADRLGGNARVHHRLSLMDTRVRELA